MHTFYTYVWIIDGVERYVGFGSEPARWMAHLHRGRSYFSRFLRARRKEESKIGVNIFAHKSIEDAQKHEIALIAQFGRANTGCGPLMNLTDGGEGTIGRVDSEDTKTKRNAAVSRGKTGVRLSAAHKRNVGLSRLGHIQSENTKAKISAANKGKNTGRIHTPENIAKRSKRCTVDNGMTIFPSVRELMRVLGKGKSGSRHPDFKYLPDSYK
jgi:hypothetical protein